MLDGSAVRLARRPPPAERNEASGLESLVQQLAAAPMRWLCRLPLGCCATTVICRDLIAASPKTIIVMESGHLERNGRAPICGPEAAGFWL